MKRKLLRLISLLLAAFVINLDTTIVNVALPTLVRDPHASNSQLQWVVDALNLLFAASVLAMGSLSDRFGRKGMLLALAAAFVAWERRTEHPMLDLSLFRNPRFTAAGAVRALLLLPAHPIAIPRDRSPQAHAFPSGAPVAARI